MIDNEFLRQKREREFQQRVIKALERPKTNSVWTILNSRLFSVVVIGAFATMTAGYFTHHQQCTRDANQIGDRWQRLTREIFIRQSRLNEIVQNANTISEMRQQIPVLPVTYADFRERSLFELARERDQLRGRIRSLWFAIRLRANVLTPTSMRTWQRERYGGVEVASIGRNVRDDEIRELQAYAAAMHRINADVYQFERDLVLTATCTPRVVLATILGRKPFLLEYASFSTDGGLVRD